MCDTLKSDAFKRPAILCIKEITRRLKVDRPLPSHNCREPSRTAVWGYVTGKTFKQSESARTIKLCGLTSFLSAYFTSTYNAEFGVVQRQWFEGRLQSELESQTQDPDTAWYALKNAVLAVGSRLAVSRTNGFEDACRTSWGFFENALSMHTQLLYEHTSLIGVQALIVMVLVLPNPFPIVKICSWRIGILYRRRRQSNRAIYAMCQCCPSRVLESTAQTTPHLMEYVEQ